MVGIRSFPFGMAYFQGRTVSLCLEDDISFWNDAISRDIPWFCRGEKKSIEHWWGFCTSISKKKQSQKTELGGFSLSINPKLRAVLSPCGDYFKNHEIKIPGSLWKTTKMTHGKSPSFFLVSFFVAHVLRHWYSNVGGSIVKMGDSDIHMPIKTTDKKHKAQKTEKSPPPPQKKKIPGNSLCFFLGWGFWWGPWNSSRGNLVTSNLGTPKGFQLVSVFKYQTENNS